jgi:hypothetical protein
LILRSDEIGKVRSRHSGKPVTQSPQRPAVMAASDPYQ